MGFSARWLAMAAVVASIMVSGCSAANRDSVGGHLGSETLVIANGAETVTVEAGAPTNSTLGVELIPSSAFAVSASGPGVATVSRRKGGARAQRLTVRLSPTRFWQIAVRGGATATVLDLSGLMLSKVEVTGGAERMTIALPKPLGRAIPVEVTGGATTVAVEIASGTAIQVMVAPGIGRGTVVGSSFVSDGARRVFQVGGYSTAAESYSLDLTGGANSLVVSEP